MVTVGGDLDRFKHAQEGRYAGVGSALAELRSGAKQGHWIWYVFPQLSGLGTSGDSRRYGIRGFAEAVEYLRDPVLRSRLLDATMAVANGVRGNLGISLDSLMGARIDVLKLVSSLTLFERVARRLHMKEGLNSYALLATAAEEVLDVAASQGYPRCRHTLEQVESSEA